MDFWIFVAGFFMVLAFGISLMEVYQVWIQRKVITEIRDKLKEIDVDKIMTSATDASKTSIAALQISLSDLLAPLRDKALSIDLDAVAASIGVSVQAGIAEFSSKIDVQAMIDALAETMVIKVQEAIPKMVNQAGGDIMKEKAKFIQQAKKDPLGTFLGLALDRMVNKPAAAPAAQATGEQAGSSPLRII